MHVQLKLFATLHRYLPPDNLGDTCDAELPAGAQVRDLLIHFGVPLDQGMVILINGRQAELDQTLREGDVVAAFPAMAGGAR